MLPILQLTSRGKGVRASNTRAAAMRYRLILCSTLLVLATLAEAQETVAPAVATESSEPRAALKAGESIDTQILERIELPVVADTPSRTILVDPGVSIATEGDATDETQPDRQPGATAAVTVDLGAVRSRVGTGGDIQVVREGQSLAESVGDRGTITLKRGDILTVRHDRTVQPVAELPGVTTSSSSTILYTLDGSGDTRELGLFHRSAGLHWRSDRAHFMGELLVGVLDRENPQAQESLEGVTIPVQLLAPPGTLDRTDIQLVRIGSPFERVAVATDLTRDPFPVELVSQVDPDIPRAELRVFRPQLALSVPSAIQGLGVEEAVVTVSGMSTHLRPGEMLTLELDNGWLADPTVEVGESGTASTRIRSNWLGSGTLRVRTSPYEATPKEIEYSVPLRFVVATLLGAMLGGCVFTYMLNRRKPPAERFYVTDWIIGLIIGTGATTMAYAGMKLPEWISVPPVLAGDIAPFALAFICAAVGTTFIHSIVGAARKPAIG